MLCIRTFVGRAVGERWFSRVTRRAICAEDDVFRGEVVPARIYSDLVRGTDWQFVPGLDPYYFQSACTTSLPRAVLDQGKESEGVAKVEMKLELWPCVDRQKRACGVEGP